MKVPSRWTAASSYSTTKFKAFIFATKRTVRLGSYCTDLHNVYDPQFGSVDGYKHLQAHVATSAFDSAQYVDAPKSHPNTRKAVLDEIINWIVLTVTRAQWVLCVTRIKSARFSDLLNSQTSLWSCNWIITERSQEYYIDRSTLVPPHSTWSALFSVMAFKFVNSNGNRGMPECQHTHS